MAGHISALRFQKRTSERVNVFLDGSYAFALPATVAAGLRPGQDLSDEDIARLKALDEQERAYERCLRFLAYRPRSTAEVRRYLERRELPESVIDSAIERLTAANYLDDEAFARFWVSDRERFSPKGPMALRYELRQKGIAEGVIAEVLKSVNTDESAYRAGLSRARRLANQDERAFRQKLGGHLLRRGFTHEQVWPVVERLWLETQHSDSEDEDAP